MEEPVFVDIARLKIGVGSNRCWHVQILIQCKDGGGAASWLQERERQDASKRPLSTARVAWVTFRHPGARAPWVEFL